MANLLSERVNQGVNSQIGYKMKWLLKLIRNLLLLSLLTMTVLYAVWQNEDFQRKYIYPYPFREKVEYYADRYNVDSSLVAGVILAESKFKQEATSSHGAKGVMQLMPETATWIAKQIEDDNFSIEKLYNPDTNIKYGTWYLAELQDEFEGNEVLILAAYNAGRGNVHDWMKKYHWDMNFKDYEKIPFPETREYVKKVLNNKQEYNRLYK